ncbi:cytochrome c556 [Luteibacter sp. Sphag1AF]|uniref:cytochrome c n=1 Tax=Luteibacter sp. Sphag1AF TaxID=2587031 RepID=UPI001609E257|nr:cytochrome c [Luteibacter sp. Sphag1AF]MBB3227140.1 cytochrome c556 [Luteibacter sp. Sphag1AF]
MRALLLILLGLAIGAMGATAAISALRQGTPYHRGVMAVMQHHMGVLRDHVRQGQCEATSIQKHLSHLSDGARDIDEAFPSMDDGFYTAARRLDSALDAAQKAGPATCEALAAALKPVGDACQSCHQNFR